VTGSLFSVIFLACTHRRATTRNLDVIRCLLLCLNLIVFDSSEISLLLVAV
jgi:hypothetical protein